MYGILFGTNNMFKTIFINDKPLEIMFSTVKGKKSIKTICKILTD